MSTSFFLYKTIPHTSYRRSVRVSLPLSSLHDLRPLTPNLSAVHLLNLTSDFRPPISLSLIHNPSPAAELVEAELAEAVEAKPAEPEPAAELAEADPGRIQPRSRQLNLTNPSQQLNLPNPSRQLNLRNQSRRLNLSTPSPAAEPVEAAEAEPVEAEPIEADPGRIQPRSRRLNLTNPSRQLSLSKPTPAEAVEANPAEKPSPAAELVEAEPVEALSNSNNRGT
ncbi:MAG: hypothetical protein HY961_04540 [Ignavibacteriae bacterium]|nr:hypothetical protein [Ignavibacteriota bacterium]